MIAVDQGNTEQRYGTIEPADEAEGYELPYAAVPTAGAPVSDLYPIR